MQIFHLDRSIQPASSANLFGSGFKKNDLSSPMESFENHQFDSFVNDSKPQQANYLGQVPAQSNFQQQQLFASSNQQKQSVMTSVPPPPFSSLPPMGSNNQGPPFQKFSGPTSLEERSSVSLFLMQFITMFLQVFFQLYLPEVNNFVCFCVLMCLLNLTYILKLHNVINILDA